MANKEVFYKVLEQNMKPFLENFFQNSGLSRDDIDVAFIHQPSLPLFRKGLKESGVAESKVVQDLLMFGNTIAAEQPLSLDTCIRNGKVKRGDKIFLLTYGSGLTGGSAAFKY